MPTNSHFLQTTTTQSTITNEWTNIEMGKWAVGKHTNQHSFQKHKHTHPKHEKQTNKQTDTHGWSLNNIDQQKQTYTNKTQQTTILTSYNTYVYKRTGKQTTINNGKQPTNYATKQTYTHTNFGTHAQICKSTNTTTNG